MADPVRQTTASTEAKAIAILETQHDNRGFVTQLPDGRWQVWTGTPSESQRKLPGFKAGLIGTAEVGKIGEIEDEESGRRWIITSDGKGGVGFLSATAKEKDRQPTHEEAFLGDALRDGRVPLYVTDFSTGKQRFVGAAHPKEPDKVLRGSDIRDLGSRILDDGSIIQTLMFGDERGTYRLEGDVEVVDILSFKGSPTRVGVLSNGKTINLQNVKPVGPSPAQIEVASEVPVMNDRGGLAGTRVTFNDGDSMFVPAAKGQPAAETFQDPDSGQWFVRSEGGARLTPFDPPGQAASVETIGSRDFVHQPSGELDPLPPQTIDDLIGQAFEENNWDAVLALDDFKKRPTRAQSFQFALEFAKSPADQRVLSKLARGEGPIVRPEGLTTVGPVSNFLQQSWNEYQQSLTAGGLDNDTLQGLMDRLNRGTTLQQEQAIKDAETDKKLQDQELSAGEQKLASLEKDIKTAQEKLKEALDAKRTVDEDIQFGGSVSAAAVQNAKSPNERLSLLAQAAGIDFDPIVPNPFGPDEPSSTQVVLDKFYDFENRNGRLVAIRKGGATGQPERVAQDIPALTPEQAQARQERPGLTLPSLGDPSPSVQSDIERRRRGFFTAEEQAAQQQVAEEFLAEDEGIAIVPWLRDAAIESEGQEHRHQGGTFNVPALSQVARGTGDVPFGFDFTTDPNRLGFDEPDFFAHGGIAQGNNLEVVGEQGPELVDLAPGSVVTPLRSLSKKQAKALKRRGIRGLQGGGVVFDDLPLGIQQLQAGRAITPSRGRLSATAGFTIPSAQGLQNLLPSTQEALFGLAEFARIPRGDFEQELATAQPRGRRLPQGRLRPLSFRGVR